MVSLPDKKSTPFKALKSPIFVYQMWTKSGLCSLSYATHTAKKHLDNVIGYIVRRIVNQYKQK